jgi:DNA-binding CsgD family transcriptional regulator
VTGCENNARLVAAIYDAALDPRQWPQVLGQLAERFHSASAHLSFENTAGTQGRLISYGTDPVNSRRYADYYVTRNVLWQRIVKRGLENVVTDRIIMPKEELERSEFYNDFLKPQEGEEILASLAVRGANGGTSLTLWRPQRFGIWDREEMDALAELTPHLRRAVELNGSLGEVRLVHALACEALNRLDRGVMLLDSNARILFANCAAEALLGDGAGLRLEEHRLAAGRPAETTALRQLIAETGRSGAGGALAIPRERRSALTVFAVAVTPQSIPECADPTGVLILVRDPETAAEPSLAAFARHFGLTPSQAAVAKEVTHGDGVAAAAKRLGISYGTARAHLLQAFQKTGTRRQAQLTRMMLEWNERGAISGAEALSNG